MSDPLAAWGDLPRRVYLDTSTLQDVYEYGGVVFEGEPFVAARGDRRDGLEGDLLALRAIFEVNQRAHFELVVSEASLSEVHAWRGRPNFLQWVHDVLEVWLVQSAAEVFEASAHDVSRIGSISAKDARLLQDALDLRCDGFLTMERRLATQQAVVRRDTGLRVMRPGEFWSLLSPWARLYL